MLKKKSLIVSLLVLFSITFSGCNLSNSIELKLGLRNDSFEYINEGKVEKIVIQNERDKGFRFVVTDKRTIKDLYDILSKAKETDKKTEIPSDYIIELHESPVKIYKFNYVVGLSDKNQGNLYSEEKNFIVSGRLDNDIIKNFWNSRKPIDFENIYYKSILDTIDKYKNENESYDSLSLKFYEDIDISKYILSVNLEKFKKEFLNRNVGSLLIEEPNQEENSSVEMSVKSVGYTSSLYKGIVTFYNRKTKKEDKYYIWNNYNYDFRQWTYGISDKKQDKF